MHEWIGYIASVVIATSMLMNSLQKLRWINLVGAILFSTYGFIIGAMPVGILNGFIVLIDVYYLQKMYTTKDYFRLLEVRNDNKYLEAFLEFHHKDIIKFFPDFIFKPEMNKLSFLILKNMSVAGVILAHEYDEKTLKIGLDYVIPAYRDQKPGKFVYSKNLYYFSKLGYEKLCAEVFSKKHSQYLQKMGFKSGLSDNANLLIKRLVF
ncbi:MAG: hypothetical protein NTZ33_09695 [Bacteroidetes bacterium]|nr:hypothetical protein [Bacteroidota bacterium]